MDQGYDPARSTGNIYIAGKPAERRRQLAPQASFLPSTIRSLATTPGQVLVGNGEREGRSAGCRQLPSPPPHSQSARQDAQDRDPHLSRAKCSESVLRGAGDGEREEEYGDEYDMNEDQCTDLAQEDATARDGIFGTRFEKCLCSDCRGPLDLTCEHV